MRRFFNYKSLLTLLPIAAIAFVVPHMAHASTILPDWMDTGSSIVGNILTSWMEVFLLPLAAGVLYLAGSLLDATIQFSLHTAYIFSLSPAINLGWTIIRDLCNIFFIFILIWISLGTIVNGLRFGTSTMLKNVVIAAILINFSLFITKAVIDVSNVFGNWLYTGVEATLAGSQKCPLGEACSLSGFIVQRMGLLNSWQAVAGQTDAKNLADPSQSFTGRMLRLAVTLIAIYIFFYAAVLFLARAIELLFLLIFSPIGFMGKILPQIEDYSKEWRNELTSVAMFPLVFLIMLYLSLQFINSIDALGAGFATATGVTGATPHVPGSSFTVAQYFNYFIIIFLLHATLKISKKYSGEMGEKLGGMAEGLGKLAVNAVGTYATGGASMLLRAGGRGLGAALSAESGQGFAAFKKTGLENLNPTVAGLLTGDSKILKYVKNPRIALKDSAEAVTTKMKTGTWDIRNVPTGQGTVGDLLTGTVGRAIESKAIDLKALDSKAVKTQQAEWTEEKKIEKANTEILKDIEGDLKTVATSAVINLESKLNAANETRKALDADPANPAKRAAYDAAASAYVAAQKAYDEDPRVIAAHERISAELQKLGSKQTEKLSKGITKNSEIVGLMSQSQVENLADKAENDEDKAKVWATRLQDVSTAVRHGADIQKAIKSHSDEELQNLTAATLTDPSFVSFEKMDYDKYDKLSKSKKLTGITKGKMKDARYNGLYALVTAATPPAIANAVKGMKAPEISKLGDKFFRNDLPTVPPTPRLNVNTLEALISRGNTDVFDKMVQNDTDEKTRELIRDYVNAAAPRGGNYQKIADWMSSGRGTAF